MVPNVTRRAAELTPTSVCSPLCMCINYRPPQKKKKLSTMIGQLARKSISLSSPSSSSSSPLLSSPLFFSHINFKASHGANETDLQARIDKKTTRMERRHTAVWEWCRQLSVLLESDQTGLARLLHYILAQSKIVWPGTALPLGAQSFTTHRLYCTQRNQLVFRSLHSTHHDSPSLCVQMCVCDCMCECERKRVRRRGRG